MREFMSVQCDDCDHEHYSELELPDHPDDAGYGTLWCDTPICGDGCCHCPCYLVRTLGPIRTEWLPGRMLDRTN